MKSYTTGRNLAGTLTKNSSSANLTYLDEIANDDYRHICALLDWPFLEALRTLSTTADTAFTTLPYDCDLVREIAVIPTGSTIRYTPRPVSSRTQWDQLNLSTTTSDIPEYYFVFAGQVGLWPTPTSTGNTIYVTQKSRVVDLAIADYTTGSIDTATNGSTALVGTGTSWNASMVGRWIKIDQSASANGGDGLWYEIAGVTDTTNLTLTRAYGGTSISSGSASYTIAQVPLLPEAYHDLPWIWAAGMYWQKEGDPERAKSFLDVHGRPPQGNQPATGRIKTLMDTYSSPTTDLVLDEGEYPEPINPNLTISL